MSWVLPVSSNLHEVSPSYFVYLLVLDQQIKRSSEMKCNDCPGIGYTHVTSLSSLFARDVSIDLPILEGRRS